MSVSSVGSASNAASLQKQYLADLKTLAADQTNKANQQVITLDQARVVQDAAALAALTAQQAQAQQARIQPKPATAAETTSAVAKAVTGVGPGVNSSTKVDLYL
jgi:hypothetical protein